MTPLLLPPTTLATEDGWRKMYNYIDQSNYKFMTSHSGGHLVVPGNPTMFPYSVSFPTLIDYYFNSLLLSSLLSNFSLLILMTTLARAGYTAITNRPPNVMAPAQ